MDKQLGSASPISGRRVLQVLLIALIFAGAGTFIIIYRFMATEVVEDLSVGSVASRDIVAPRQVIYTSEIETEARRKQKVDAVDTIYTAPDTRVARAQVNRLGQIFDYMEAVKADPFGLRADKFAWIEAIVDLSLSDAVIDTILALDDTEWKSTRQEARLILEQAMRNEIRPNQDLVIRRQLPTRVGVDTPERQATVIVDIVSDLIRPNTFPDEARTEAARQEAAESVEPVRKTVEEGERIIGAGEVVDRETLEKLNAITIDQPGVSFAQRVMAPTILMLVITTILSVYLLQYTPKLLIDNRRLSLLVGFVLAFIALAKIMFSVSPSVAYLYPIAALSMMIAILIDTQLAFLLTAILGVLTGYIAGDAPAGLVIYLIVSGWTGALAIGHNQRVNAIILAGVYVGIVNAAMAYIFNLTLELNQVGILVLAGLFNGIFLSTALALVGLLILGNLFGITTAIQLVDLGRPTQPLLRQLLLKAPGTYHHSLMVSNLAEQAAERIGADSLLVRVMAYYHDIGKMQRPYFFIENQPEGMTNVHEKLDPKVSAQIIISHTKDGLEMATKYRLPRAIKDGIAQHHGTSLVKFFYYQAVEMAKDGDEEVDEAAFRYPGPKPQNRENGILMLADGSESAVRALKPRSADEIDEIVQKIIAHNLNSGQLDECDLTISDLRAIRSAFVDILQGVHHPRIKYPEQAKTEEPAEAAEPEQEQPLLRQPTPPKRLITEQKSLPLQRAATEPSSATERSTTLERGDELRPAEPQSPDKPAPAIRPRPAD